MFLDYSYSRGTDYDAFFIIPIAGVHITTYFKLILIAGVHITMRFLLIPIAGVHTTTCF